MAWTNKTDINKILLAFNIPKTPKQVEKELRLNKLKLKPFLDKNLLESLNQKARKGRLYVLTNYARKLLKIQYYQNKDDRDWDSVGWIKASPKQRLVVLKTVALDRVKRTSEDIRIRASTLNPHLTRISIKGILSELANRRLIYTCMNDRRRYYWISEKGKRITKDIGPV